MKTLFPFLFCLLMFVEISAQQTVTGNSETVELKVQAQVAGLLNTRSFRHKQVKDFRAARGFVIAGIILNDKGKTVSVFIEDTDISDIGFLEYLTNELLKQRYDCRPDKGKNLKIKQKITIQ